MLTDGRKTGSLYRAMTCSVQIVWGWSGDAMVLGKLPVLGRPTVWWGLFGHFYSHLSFLFSFSLSLGDGPI